jgi:hypothetical protein
MATHWSKESKEQMGQAIDRLVQKFKQEQAGRKSRYLRNLSLYELRKIGTLNPASYGDLNDGNNEDRLGLVRSAVETVKATILAPQKPKPQFQTLGATWNARRAAYRYDRICEGILNERQSEYVNVWAFMLDAVTDGVIQGSTAVKVTADHDRESVCHQNVPIINLFVDPVEGRNPTCLYEIAPMTREQAFEKWPSAKTAIENARTWDWFDASRTAADTDVIEIIYAWRLQSSKKQKGKFCTVIGGSLVEPAEDWPLPAYPFVFFHWTRHRLSFWASGVADEAASQVEDVSDIDVRYMARSKLACGTKGFYAEGSLGSNKLEGNEPVEWIAVKEGSPFPIQQTTQPFGPAELEWRGMRIQQVWDTIGVSQVSAAARREQGLSSGIAIMTNNDTKAGRQLPKAQAYENVFVDLAQQYVWRLRELAKKNPKFQAKWHGKRSIYALKFSETDLDDDKWSVTVAPASNLPYDPAGRQEMVSQLLASGIISRDTARTLIGWPDIDNELDIQNAEGEYIDDLIEACLEADEETWDNPSIYQAPEAFITNKIGALRRFSSAWFRARVDQRQLPPEERAKAEFNIKLLSRWMIELDLLIRNEAMLEAGLKRGAPAAPAQQSDGGAPQAPPPPPPLLQE